MSNKPKKIQLIIEDDEGNLSVSNYTNILAIGTTEECVLGCEGLSRLETVQAGGFISASLIPHMLQQLNKNITDGLSAYQSTIDEECMTATKISKAEAEKMMLRAAHEQEMKS